MKKVVLPALFLLVNFLLGNSLFAATHISVASGNFTAPSTWDCNCVPTSTDSITISSGHTVTLTANTTIQAFTVNVGGVLDNNGFTLNLNGGRTIIDGEYTGTGATNWLANTNATTSVITGTGIVSTSGDWTINSTSTWVTINAGTNLTFSNSSITISGGTLYCFGAITLVNGNITVNSSQTLRVESGTGNVTLGIGNISILSGGKVDNYGTVTVGGNITGSSALSQWQNYGTLNISGNFLTTGSLFTASGNTVNYNGSGNQTIKRTSTTIGFLAADNYYNLKCSNAGTKTLAAHTTINGDLTIQNNAQLDVSKDGGTTNYNINLKGNWINTSTNADPFIERNDTVTFSGTAPQTITSSFVAGGETFYNLVLNNSGTGVVLTGGNINVSDTLTLNDGLIHTGTDTVFVSNTDMASIKGYSDTSYVNGYLKRSISPTGGKYDFPVGNAYAYELANVDFFGSDTIGTLTMNFSNPTGGTALSSLTDANDAVYDKLLNCGGIVPGSGNANSGVWNIRPGKGSAIYDLSLHGRHFDNHGTMYHSIVKRSNSGSPWAFAGTYLAASQTSDTLIARRTCLTDFYEFAIAESNTLTPLNTTPLSFLSLDTMICGGKCIDFVSKNNFSATSWRWTRSGTDFSVGSDSALQNPSNICFNTTGNYDVRLIASTACEADTLEKIQYIKVSPIPTATITGETSICSGKRIVLSGTSTIPGLTYLWSTGSTSQYIGTIPLTNTIYSLVVSNEICSDTASVNIIVTTTPTASITTNTTAICGGENALLSVIGTAETYLWSNGATTNTIVVSPTSTQSYTVTLSNGNCVATDEITINVTTTPTAFITGETSICSGKKIILSGISMIPGVTYLWSIGSTNQSINATPLTSTSYSLVLSNGICRDTASIRINVTTSPTLTITANLTAICSGEKVLISGKGTAENYLWNTGATTSSITVSPLNSTYYQLKESNGSASDGCFDADSVRIIVTTTPTITISPNKDLCSGDQTIITASGGSDYTWSFNSLKGNSIFVNPEITTTYSVTANGGNGCKSTATSTVTMLNKPVLTITKTDAACGQSNGTALVTVSGKSPYTYLWTSGTSVIGLTPNVSNLVAKGYEVKVTDGNGCISTDNANIGNTGGGPSVSNFNSTNASCLSICDGIATVSVIGGVLPYSYLWNSPNAETSQTAFNLCQNTYEVKITDGAGCKVSAILKVGTDGADPTISGLIKIKIDGVPEVVKKGFVALYRFRAEKALELIVSAPISATGTYSLPYFKEGDYLIAAEADTNMYPYSAKTYYGEKIKWTEADTVQAPCNSSNLISINIINLPPKIGKGKIKGQIKDVSGGKTFAAGDPIPGVDISLEQIPGGIVATGKTSSKGEYNFDNLPEGKFEVFVDMPGLKMNHTHQIAVSPTDTVFNDANFWVDSTGTIDTIIQKIITNIPVQVKNENFTYSVYPNPYTGTTNIVYTLEEKSNVNIEVYNVLGELIKTIENKKDQQAGNYQMKFNAEENGCGAGIYILRLTINGRGFTQRMSQMN